MQRLPRHLRNSFLAGIFAAAPIAVTVFVVVYVENLTRTPLAKIGINVPFVGVAAAVVLIYLVGLVVNSLIGRWILKIVDRILLRVPVLKGAYVAWKQISVTPGGREGMFSKVVLIPIETGRAKTLGFSTGRAIDGDPRTCCVFVPAAPNPMNGRLYFVPITDVQVLDISAEEAFKVILSSGNYVPATLALTFDSPQ
jgi:uncharacterized membrane protein